MKYHSSIRSRNPNAHPFLFATGIENSYPVVPSASGRRRVDQMASTHHYERWREDFALVKELGIRYLRYGPPYYRVHTASNSYDWSLVDEPMEELRRLGIEPILDLCHFGVPDWVGNFQNPDWPELFAGYAGAFAERYPWVRFYTPVNEIFVCANFSAYLGWWNEALSSDLGFVTAVKHLCRATILAEEAIIRFQDNAMFVQSESSEHFHAEEPAAAGRAAFLNERRFLSLDLCYGNDVSATMYEYLIDNGLTRQQYNWFLERGQAIKQYCIMGNDYYITNEHWVPAESPPHPAGDLFGYYIITRQYYERYHMPVMHTETNHRGGSEAEGDAVRWLHKQWANMVYLKQTGVPILGFTWYSLTDQVDWDTALRENNGRVNPLGLVDLERRLHPVGHAYRKLVETWRDILPMESHGLDLPG